MTSFAKPAAQVPAIRETGLAMIDPGILKDDAARAFDEKRFVAAQIAYADLQATYPDDPFFADRHAHCHQAQEHWQSALRAWLLAISCHGLTTDRLNQVALCLIEMASYQAAADLCHLHREDLPLDGRSFVLATLASIGSGDFTRATEACRQLAARPAEETTVAREQLRCGLRRLAANGLAENVARWVRAAPPTLTGNLAISTLDLPVAICATPDICQKLLAERRKAGTAAAQDIIKAAHRTAQEDGPQSAFDFLQSARASLQFLPPQYDGTVGIMAARAGLCTEALFYLESARLSFRIPPPWILRMLAVALLGIDRAAVAGRILHQAAQAGAPTLDINAQIAICDFPPPSIPAPQIDHRHVHGLSFLDESRNLSYLAIPKNACSVLKTTFVMNSPLKEAYLASKQSIHQFFPSAAKAIDPQRAIACNPARILVLRDPLSRLVSCYLSKFARPYVQRLSVLHTTSSVVEKIQARLGLARDPARSISFAEFVAYVVKTPDAACDLHWLPQHRLCGDDMSIYAHVGRFERLGDTLAFLQDRYGMQPQTDMSPHIEFPETGVSHHDPNAADCRAWSMLPAELRAMTRGFPPTEAFYNAELREIVMERYATDARLHAAA